MRWYVVFAWVPHPLDLCVLAYDEVHALSVAFDVLVPFFSSPVFTRVYRIK
jgi:hypothetical protein